MSESRFVGRLTGTSREAQRKELGRRFIELSGRSLTIGREVGAGCDAFGTAGAAGARQVALDFVADAEWRHRAGGVEPVLGEAEQMPFRTRDSNCHDSQQPHNVATGVVWLNGRVVTPGGGSSSGLHGGRESEREEVWERAERMQRSRPPADDRRQGEVSELLAEHGLGEEESKTWTGLVARPTGSRWRNTQTRRRRQIHPMVEATRSS